MTFSEQDERFMRRALKLAELSAQQGEVPVGAVIVKEGVIIAEGRNLREQSNSALSHAETEAIAAAGKALGDWRLDGCKMYVTLEPCPMCAGAIISARLDAVYYGSSDCSLGAVGSVINMFDMPFGHRPAIFRGLLLDECSKILSDFFTKVRNFKI